MLHHLERLRNNVEERRQEVLENLGDGQQDMRDMYILVGRNQELLFLKQRINELIERINKDE